MKTILKFRETNIFFITALGFILINGCKKTDFCKPRPSQKVANNHFSNAETPPIQSNEPNEFIYCLPIDDSYTDTLSESLSPPEINPTAPVQIVRPEDMEPCLSLEDLQE